MWWWTSPCLPDWSITFELLTNFRFNTRAVHPQWPAPPVRWSKNVGCCCTLPRTVARGIWTVLQPQRKWLNLAMGGSSSCPQWPAVQPNSPVVNSKTEFMLLNTIQNCTRCFYTKKTKNMFHHFAFCIQNNQTLTLPDHTNFSTSRQNLTCLWVVLTF